MAHKCDACGRTFETLTSRRLHNCSAETSQDYTFFDEDFDVTERIKKRNEKRRRERRRLVEKAVGDRLDNVLAAAHSGGPVEAFTAVARFEQELREALRRDDDGETYMAVFWTYLEPVSEAVNETARNEGWPFIADLVDGYDPQVDEGLPHVAGVVANVVARGIIRARLPVTEATRDSRSLDRVPPSALTYLENIPRYDEGSSIVAWEESIHYGWAVGHPDVPVRSTISDLIDVDPVWSGDAAAQALIASQNESVELFCEVLRRAPVEDRAFIASILSRLEGEPPADRFPRFWDPETALDQDDPFTFTFDERVADELRSTIEELGLASRLDSDWDFADLEY